MGLISDFSAAAWRNWALCCVVIGTLTAVFFAGFFSGASFEMKRTRRLWNERGPR